MTRQLRTIGGPLIACALALAGCGQSFDQLEREGLDAIDRLSQLEPTPLAAMPDRGGARYQGTAFVGFDAAEGFGSAASRITLDADFAAKHVNGRMHDWALNRGNRIDNRLDGELKVYAGSITGNTMTAYASGNLDDGDRIGAVGLTLDGVFLGGAAQGVAGSITGQVGYSNADGGLRDIDNGTFAAER